MSKQQTFEEVRAEIRETLRKARKHSIGISEAVEIIEAYRKHVPYLLDVVEGRVGVQQKLL